MNICGSRNISNYHRIELLLNFFKTIFVIIINVYTFTFGQFNVSLLNKSFFLKKKKKKKSYPELLKGMCAILELIYMSNGSKCMI